MSDEPIYTGVGLVYAADSSDAHYVDIDTMGAAVDLAGPTRLVPQTSYIVTGGGVDHVRNALVTGKDGLGLAYQMSYPQQASGQGSGFLVYKPPLLAATKTHVISYLFKMTGAVAGAFAIKWFLFPLNHQWIGQGGGEPQWSTHNAQPFVSSSGKDTFWQVYHTITDEKSPYPDGHDQGTQPFGPYLQDLFDGQWHRATHAYKCHTVEPTSLTVTANGSKVAPALFEASMAGKFVNGDIIGVQGIGGCIVSGFDGTTHCTLTSINRPFAPIATNPAVSTSATGGSIPAATKYYYRVQALYPDGSAQASTEVSVTTGAGSTNSNTVTWDAMPNAIGYYVWRLTASGAGSGTRFDIAAGTTSYTDTGTGGTAEQGIGYQVMDPSQPFVFSTVFDGFMKMWVDGVKILDGSKEGLNYTPPGGEKQYIGRDDFYNQIVGLANGQNYGPRWGGFESAGFNISTGVMVNFGDGDPTNPDTLKWWAVDTVVTAGGTATQLLLSLEPAGAVSGQPLTQQPVVAVADAGGSTVTSDTSTVTAEWVSLTGDATPSGTLTKAAVSGVAAFTDLGLSWTVASTGYWTFTDGSLTSVNSNTLTLTVAPPDNPPPPDYGITPGAPAVYRMARGKALFAGFRRMVRAVWRWLTLSASLA